MHAGPRGPETVRELQSELTIQPYISEELLTWGRISIGMSKYLEAAQQQQQQQQQQHVGAIVYRR